VSNFQAAANKLQLRSCQIFTELESCAGCQIFMQLEWQLKIKFFIAEKLKNFLFYIIIKGEI